MSMDAEGYVTELGYTLGYYAELDPRAVAQRLCALGFQPPSIRRACEPGFGQGLSLAIHAVAGEAEWWGNDLLPQHVGTLRELTAGLTNRLHIYGESFAEFCVRPELPHFDFIALHGVWSWVSAANRNRLVAFMERCLAPQGVVYLSYNARAAWASVTPLREFLVKHAARAELAHLPLAERIEAALLAAQGVVAADLSPARDTPAFERHLRAIRHQSKAYLAHEYFNRDWLAFAPEEIAAALAPLGLEYAGQARAGTEGDAAQPFRRDLWVRCLKRRGGEDPRTGAIASSAKGVEPLALSPDPTRRASVRQLNHRLLQRARRDPYLTTLASPLSGGGVEFHWRTLLAFAAWCDGVDDAGGIANSVDAVLATLGHPFVHRDVVIRDAAERRRMLEREAQEFLAITLERLRRLGIEEG
jgi:SAM-dependent methyltransferase